MAAAQTKSLTVLRLLDLTPNNTQDEVYIESFCAFTIEAFCPGDLTSRITGSINQYILVDAEKVQSLLQFLPPFSCKFWQNRSDNVFHLRWIFLINDWVEEPASYLVLFFQCLPKNVFYKSFDGLIIISLRIKKINQLVVNDIALSAANLSAMELLIGSYFIPGYIHDNPKDASSSFFLDIYRDKRN